MPNIKSAKKRVKVIAAKTLRNKAIKSELKTYVKKANNAEENKAEAVRDQEDRPGRCKGYPAQEYRRQKEIRSGPQPERLKWQHPPGPCHRAFAGHGSFPSHARSRRIRNSEIASTIFEFFAIFGDHSKK